MSESYTIDLKSCRKKLETVWEEVSNDSTPSYSIESHTQVNLSRFGKSTQKDNSKTSQRGSESDDDPESYIDNNDIINDIYRILSSDSKAFKYAVVTAILAKSVNESIHMRALKKNECDLDGAYSPRGMCHREIVDWEARIGDPLGGSREPYKNTAIDYPELSKSNPNRNKEVRDRTYDLLEKLNDQINDGVLDADNVLKETLAIINDLPNQLVEYDRDPPNITYYELEDLLNEYLSKSDGGTRLEAITTSVYQVFYNSVSHDDHWTVENGHANAPDQQADVAGDIEISYGGELHRAIEVKDQEVTPSMIMSIEAKIVDYHLEDYILVYNSDLNAEVKPYIRDIDADIRLATSSDLFSLCKVFNDGQRVNFLDSVWNNLRGMNASADPKEAWVDLLEKYQIDCE